MAVRLAAHAAEYDPRMIRRVFALTVLILALCAVPAFGAARTPDQVLHTKSSSGLELMTAYSTLLMRDRVGQLDDLLSRAFQIQRADGSHAGKAYYLAHLPDLRAFSFAEATEARAGDIVTVRMLCTATLFVNGVFYNPAPAPQMAVFRWKNKRWYLVAQGNFNLPKAA
jgi:hypothetical protein